MPLPTPTLFLRGQEVLGLLDSPVPALQSPLLGKIGSQEDHEAALQAARESITLLKNGHVPTRGEEEDETVKALPLDRSKGGKLLVVGPACDSFTLQSGGWTKHWQVKGGLLLYILGFMPCLVALASTIQGLPCFVLVVQPLPFAFNFRVEGLRDY